MAAERRDRGEPGAVHQQRRQEEDEDQLGVDRDRGQAGDEGHGAATDDQRRCGRERESPGNVMEANDRQNIAMISSNSAAACMSLPPFQ